VRVQCRDARRRQREAEHGQQLVGAVRFARLADLRLGSAVRTRTHTLAHERDNAHYRTHVPARVDETREFARRRLLCLDRVHALRARAVRRDRITRR
jgi:hypothetical protein